VVLAQGGNSAGVGEDWKKRREMPSQGWGIKNNPLRTRSGGNIGRTGDGGEDRKK